MLTWNKLTPRTEILVIDLPIRLGLLGSLITDFCLSVKGLPASSVWIQVHFISYCIFIFQLAEWRCKRNDFEGKVYSWINYTKFLDYYFFFFSIEAPFWCWVQSKHLLVAMDHSLKERRQTKKFGLIVTVTIVIHNYFAFGKFNLHKEQREITRT